MTTLHEIDQMTAEIRDLTAAPSPTVAAWSAVAAAVRSEWMPHRRKAGWHRTDYADCNAAGEKKDDYDSLRGVRIGSYSSAIRRVGGQNAGSYDLDPENDVLFFGADGRIYELAEVDGSWSQWQGSSSGYTLRWRVWQDAPDDAVLAEAVAALVEKLTAIRDNLRAMHRPSKFATELLARLQA